MTALLAHAQHFGGIASDDGIVGDIAGNNRPRADNAMRTNALAARENNRPGSNPHIPCYLEGFGRRIGSVAYAPVRVCEEVPPPLHKHVLTHHQVITDNQRATVHTEIFSDTDMTAGMDGLSVSDVRPLLEIHILAAFGKQMLGATGAHTVRRFPDKRESGLGQTARHHIIYKEIEFAHGVI